MKCIAISTEYQDWLVGELESANKESWLAAQQQKQNWNSV
jgi:hypothetical protein